MKLTLTRPDDWHLHLRDGSLLHAVVTDTAQRFARAIIMPNLRPPITTTEQALAYRERIRSCLAQDSQFEPLMTLYLTDNLAPVELYRAQASGAVVAVKLYPAGATTNSDFGVSALDKVYSTLATMEEIGLILLIHGEVTRPEVDIFDRERAFLEEVLDPLIRRFPKLRLVLEHVTTKEGVEFVQSAPQHVAATITAHHLLYNRNHLLAGAIRPHFYCLPVLKREQHRRALLEAAISGNPKFFLGTDSAPHTRSSKESACGCAGCYTAHAAIELYAEAFEEAGALERLEGFASYFGPDFYGLPRNREQITLIKNPWQVPSRIRLDSSKDTLIPLRAGETIGWRTAPPQPKG